MIGHYGKRGKASRMSFVFVWGSKTFILFGSSLTIWLGRRQLSLSFPLFVADRRSEYVFMLVWFLLGTLVYFLFFIHFCIHSRLSSDCDWLAWWPPSGGENNYQCTAGQRSRWSHSCIEDTLSELAGCSHKLQIISDITFLNYNCQCSGKYILVRYRTRKLNPV